MKAVKFGLALAMASALASSAVMADNGKHKGNAKSGGKVARVYDVCVDGTAGAKLTNFPPSAGDRVTAVGMILPSGTVPADGSGDATCAAYAAQKIGTFFVNGTFVSSFAPNPIKLPEAADTDLGYVNWHFRIDGKGAIETAGPIKQFVQNGTYPQVVTGGTGRFRELKGEMKTEMLGAGGFQIRVTLPSDK
jgi:hypothetical protein